MAGKPPIFNWMADQEQKKPNLDSWSYYNWAGSSDWRARRLGLAQDPTWMSDEAYNRITRAGQPRPETALPEDTGAVTTIGGPQQDTLTPGERFAAILGVGLEATGLTPLSGFAKMLKPEPQATGTWADTRRFASDFTRSAGVSGPQTIASLGGAIADAVSGNWGQGQDYTLAGNKPGQYSDPGGAGQILGSFVPDIAMGAGAYKFGARALTGLAARATAGEATGIAGRIGGWAAAGSAEPTALKMFGRFISPAATRIDRTAAALAAALPSALHTAPEVAAGRMNATEGALTVAANALAGPLSAGQWGGTIAKNIMGDVAVNMGAQVLAEAVPAIVPGGAQFDAQQVWKNLAYGAAMGTVFGVMNSAPIQGVGERSVLGARPIPEAQVGAEVLTGNKPQIVEMAQQTEQALFGTSTLPDNATVQEANAHLEALRARGVEGMTSLQMDANGNVMAFSDQYRAQAPESAAVKNAVELEREAYANALASRYANNPEALIAALDLEVVPGEITPENAQQVLAAKINNEWLIQPVEGKGIAGVEQQLGKAGLQGVAQTPPPAEPEMTSAEAQDTYNQYRQQQRDQAVAGEPARPVYQFSSPLISVEQGAGFVGGVPRAPEPAPAPDTRGAMASIGMRADVFNSVSRASLRLGDLKTVSELEGTDVASKLTPNSLEEQLYRAEQSGMTPEEAVQYVATNTTPQTNTALQIVDNAEQRLNNAKAIAAENDIPIEAVVIPETVEAKLLEAENAGVPIEEAKAAVAEQIAQDPQSLNLNKQEQGLLDEQAAPAEAAVTGEQPVAEVKPKRPRKAREVAKTTAQAEVLEALEGPPTQVESNVEYKGQTAKMNTEPESDQVIKVASGILDVAEDLKIAQEKYAKGQDQAREEYKQGKIVKSKIRDKARSILRVAEEKSAQIAKVLQQGGEAKIYPAANGGHPTVMERVIAAAEGMHIKQFRSEVERGRTQFGAYEVTPTGAGNTYRVQLRLGADGAQKVTTAIETMGMQKPAPEVVTKTQELSRQEKIRRMNERIFADLDEVVGEQTSVENMERTQRRGGEAGPEGVSVESRSEAREVAEGEANNTGYVEESREVAEERKNWRMEYKGKLNAATAYVSKALSRLGYGASDGVTPLDIKYYIISKFGPGKFRELAQLYVDNTMPVNVRMVLDDEFNGIVQGRDIGSNSIVKFAEVNARVDESWFDHMFDEYFPKFDEAMQAAGLIAEKAGVDAQDVFTFYRWNKSGDTAEDKRRLIAKLNESSRKPVTFDDAKAAELRDKLNPLVDNDPEVRQAQAAVESFVNQRKAAEEFQMMLNENLMGRGKEYALNLRNLPAFRAAAFTGLMFGLDYATADIQDDETYFGIPGNILRKLTGEGNAGYYATLGGGFVGGVKARFKTGGKMGMRANIGNAARRMVESSANKIGNSAIESYASMTPEQRNSAADVFMAEKFPKIKPGTPEYEQVKASKLGAEDLAEVKGFQPRQALDMFRKDKKKGTIGFVSSLINDINLVGAKSPFVQEFIVKPYNTAQGQVRRLVKAVEDPINEVLPEYIKKYRKMPQFWNAFWALDYRMSEFNLSEDVMSPAVAGDARAEILNNIRKQFFERADKTINENAWSDFMTMQTRLENLRREHYRTLVARSMNINSWDIESNGAELMVTKDRLDEALGAAKQGYDEVASQIKSMKDMYDAVANTMGKEQADIQMPGYADQMLALRRAERDHRANIRKFQYEQKKVTTRLDRINQLDDMVAKSMSSYYMYRWRDGDSPLVVRIEFDPATGIPSTRLEYNSLAEAKQGRADVLRDAVKNIQATSPEYAARIAKKQQLEDRLNEIDLSDDRSPQIDAEYARITAELDKLDGYKPVSEMSDAEVFRFANDFEELGTSATIRDMRSRSAVRKGSKAAQKLIDMVMSSEEPIEAQILTRTMDNGAMTKAVSDKPDYVRGKGNSALTDADGNSQVMMFQGDDAPAVIDIVNAIDDMVDSPIDRTQLKDLLEKHYTYRDTHSNAAGSSVETVYVDMGAMRRIIEAYTDPYVPNLVRRNNWVGYYDPQGSWSTKDRINYTVKSIETMTAQIKNYNQQTSLRKSIGEAVDFLDKWEIRNGLREYVLGLQTYNDKYFKGGWWDTMADYEMSLRRGISFGTLAINVGTQIGNRIQGAAMTFAHGMQLQNTRYGVYKLNADGTKGPVQWMPTEAAARAELAAKQEKGDMSYNMAQGYTPRGTFNPNVYGLGVAAMVAPGKTLQWLAVRDGYGKLPPSQQGKWARIYQASQAANLTQGGVTGSYTVREGIKTKDRREQFLQYSGAITDYVERQNNLGSILMSGMNMESRLGLADADWQLMGQNQRSAAIDTALAPYQKRLAEAKQYRGSMQKEIEALQSKIDAIKDTPSREQERLTLEKQLTIKKERLDRVPDETQTLLDAMTDYMVFDRGFEQGNWDKVSKSKFERAIESMPGGALAMTMTAPILRSYNAWASMMRTAGQTEGNSLSKTGRMTGPLMGAAILTTLLGAAANPLTVAGGIFFNDISALGSMLYAYMTEEDGEKLDKVSSRQSWEKFARDMAPTYGIKPEDAAEFVRIWWPFGESEGIIRQDWFPVIGGTNITAGSGILSGGTPAAVIPGTVKSVWDFFSRADEAWSTGTPYDFMYAATNALPTSMKRTAQTGLQTMAPASMGGVGAVKVDKFGQPIYDKNQELQRLDGLDMARNLFLGKPWKETRSKLVMYEGGTPLYTDNDRIAWANDLAATKHVKFGESSLASMRGKGTAEQTNAALFERDAFQLREQISAVYKNKYRPLVDAGKNRLNEMYRNNELIDLGAGIAGQDRYMPFRKMLSITATGGGKAETELVGSAPDEIRKSLLRTADEWGRTKAAADVVESYYKKRVEVTKSEDLNDSDTAEEFAIRKLARRFVNSYRDYFMRQAGR